MRFAVIGSAHGHIYEQGILLKGLTKGRAKSAILTY